MKKATTITQMPAPDRCGVCTTPARCKTVALGRRGTNCAGKADGPDDCDCLNGCGDDPGIATGKSIACQNYLDRQAQATAQTEKQHQVEVDAARWRAKESTMNASHVTGICVYLMVDGQLCLAPISPESATLFVGMLPAFQQGQPAAAKLIAMPPSVAKHVEAASRSLGECTGAAQKKDTQ